jgi:hypothetical protein
VDQLGEPVQLERHSDRFGKLCRQAGLRTIHLHLVRQTLAVGMNRAGRGSLLGHAVNAYISTYLRSSEKGCSIRGQCLGAALAGGS